MKDTGRYMKGHAEETHLETHSEGNLEGCMERFTEEHTEGFTKEHTEGFTDVYTVYGAHEGIHGKTYGGIMESL